MAVRKYAPEEITYELFGIDPAEFYKTKFALGEGLADALANPVFRYEVAYEKFRRLIADLRSFLPGGGKVLDIGCGAGTYGPTLLANVPGIELHGVDMSEECLVHARDNGYRRCELFDLRHPLPYKDAAFDAVFSMDLLGHIEFRSKDALVAEMARVTVPGGAGHHGAETAFVDYFDCDPLDNGDKVRRYVLFEGHIGVEPVEAFAERFARHYSSVECSPTYLYPFAHKDTFEKCFEDDFRETCEKHGQAESIQITNLVLGRLNQYFQKLYGRVFGSAFPGLAQPPPTAEHERSREELQRRIDDHNRRFRMDFMAVPFELFRPFAFSSITLRK
jgi:ubiquinone/menaquinone biosynthesis C-methylase UbiE